MPGRRFARWVLLALFLCPALAAGQGGAKSSGSKSSSPKSSTSQSRGKVSQKKTGKAPADVPQRTRAEVDALIEQMGRTPPEWFEATALNFPQSLDLAWPEKPPGGWNNQKNVGQFVWDVINPNPGRWREGVRLMHHLLTLHRDDTARQARIMNTLGHMYHNLLEDHARAAFWWRKAGVDKSSSLNLQGGVRLAECYWQLGNKPMAVEALNRAPNHISKIKLWADMGETDKALQMARSAAPGNASDFIYLYAGDACRIAGRYPEALDWYQKVVALPKPAKPNGRLDRSVNRAKASIEAIKLFELSDVSRVPDGVYKGNSLGYEAQVHVEVVVRMQRIESVKVTDHREKQFYASLTDTPRKIIEKQGVKGVDATSSATITSEAIIYGTAKALAGAMK